MKESTMRKPRRRFLALAAMAGLAASLLAPTAARADYFGTETDYAVASSAPAGTEGDDYFCNGHYGVTVCFMPYGDKIYVADMVADGYAAVAEWQVPSASRFGSCVNKLNAGRWGVCNKNFPEDRNMWINSARYDSGEMVDIGPASLRLT